MATRTTSPYLFQEPATGQYLTERPDGTSGITPEPRQAVRFHTSAQAATYSSTRLHSTPHELVRVDA